MEEEGSGHPSSSHRHWLTIDQSRPPKTPPPPPTTARLLFSFTTQTQNSVKALSLSLSLFSGTFHNPWTPYTPPPLPPARGPRGNPFFFGSFLQTFYCRNFVGGLWQKKEKKSFGKPRPRCIGAGATMQPDFGTRSRTAHRRVLGPFYPLKLGKKKKNSVELGSSTAALAKASTEMRSMITR